LRIRPYRTTENKIDGAVIKLLDSTRSSAVPGSRGGPVICECHRGDGSRTVDCAQRRRLRVQAANRAFHRVFHITKEETDGKFIYDLDGKQWNIAPLRELLKTFCREIAAGGF